MGFILLALASFGVYAATRKGGLGAAAGAKAIDPASVNPALAAPRTQTINGIVAFTAPWLEYVLARATRYVPGPTNPTGVTGGVQTQGILRFTGTEPANSVPATTLINRSVLAWMQTQNAKGLAIVASTSLATVKFTESDGNLAAGTINPYLPNTIVVQAVPPLLLGSVAGVGSGLAVITAVPGSLAHIDL